MRLQKIVYLVTLFLVFVSCSPIIKLFTGIRDIRIESTDALIKFCTDNEMNLNDVYYYTADEQYESPDSAHINFQYADQVLIFNRNGHRIIYQGEETGNYCSLPGSDFFSGLDSPFLRIDSSQSVSNLLNNYVDLGTANTAIIKETDFYLVYYWAKWYRKFSKRSIEEIVALLENANDSMTIQSFYLNNDFVEINYPENLDFKKYKVKASF